MLTQEQAFKKRCAADIYKLVCSFCNSEDFAYRDYDISKSDFNDILSYCTDLVNSIKYYDGLIELSDNHTNWQFNGIDVSKLSSEQTNDLECTIQMFKDDAIKTFESKTGEEVFLEGRSGRHVCINNTFKNAIKYKELCDIQKMLEDKYIEKVNEYIDGL